MKLPFIMRGSALILVLAALSCTSARRVSLLSPQGAFSRINRHSLDKQDVAFFSPILELRGGETRRKHKKRFGRRTGSLSSVSQKTATGKKKAGAAAKEKKASALSEMGQKYKQILPLTRIYLFMVVFMALLGVVLGEELTQGLLALDPVRVIYGLEVWRPFTAATFFGPPSIGLLLSGYYLFQYGSSLEREYGTAQHTVFLLTQVVLLSFMSALFGQPFFAASVLTAMLHVLSRSNPNQKAKWLLFTVPFWTLPYGLMLADVLQAGSPMAALPHILGILSGHFYYFHKFVWPKIGGQEWLEAPDFLVQWLDPNAKKETKAAVSSALKARKRGKGRKLGGN